MKVLTSFKRYSITYKTNATESLIKTLAVRNVTTQRLYDRNVAI